MTHHSEVMYLLCIEKLPMILFMVVLGLDGDLRPALSGNALKGDCSSSVEADDSIPGSELSSQSDGCFFRGVPLLLRGDFFLVEVWFRDASSSAMSGLSSLRKCCFCFLGEYSFGGDFSFGGETIFRGDLFFSGDSLFLEGETSSLSAPS